MKIKPLTALIAVFGVAILMSFSGTAICVTGTTAGDGPVYRNPVVAHRGAWKNTPYTENSIGSLLSAIEMGCAGSEFDVQLTADDSLVVFHDLKRNGMVIDSSLYADIVAEPLPDGSKVPTFREYLEAGSGQDAVKFIIDIKSPANRDRTLRIASKILDVVEEKGLQDQVEFLASHLPTIVMVMERSEIPIAYLGNWRDQLPEMHPDTIFARGIRDTDYRYIFLRRNPEWIDAFRSKGVRLNTWTVDEPEQMKWFLDQKFDYITTDEPEMLLELWKQRN